ncbi:MAG: glycosyltransferase family 8 protein [Calditrichaeota bacterium]|nr:MAG: glycosyltransferase family 8 protein [Calditrichota bacterium]
MEKRLVATRCDTNIQEMTNLTHPVIKKFCKDWQADFVTLSGDFSFIMDYEGWMSYRIFELNDYFDQYDRILSLDSDVVLSPQCPNLFDIVPKGKIGTIYEDVGSRKAMRHQSIRAVQSKWGDVGWQTGYTNSGVMVLDKTHQDMLQPVDGEYWLGWESDDIHLGYQIRKFGYDIFELPFQFNHMCMFSEPWNGSPNRFLSYIIHYAGAATFPGSEGSKVDKIKKDIDVLWQNRIT